MKNAVKKIKNIRCIFLDIDNTLSTSDKIITKYTSDVLKKAKSAGIYIILCTGRTNQYAVEKSKMCNGSSIVISDNGMLIYDYELDKVYFEKNIQKEYLERILKLSVDNDVDCVFNTVYSRYRHHKFIDNSYIKTNNLIDCIDDIKENVTQIVINSENRDNLKNCSDDISKIKGLIISNTNLGSEIENKSYFCDINVNESSKGIAIEKLLKILNIEKENVVCFGDSMNDYSMFEVCGYSVAMKNASSKLKEIAYCVTDYDNNEDGVAKFIEEYIL